MGEPATSAAYPSRSAVAERRVRILEAAREQFIEQGLGGASTRDIARAADVPESSMFRHFLTKAELFEQAIAVHLEEILRSARQDDVTILARADSATARLAALTEMHGHYLEVMEQALPVLGAALFSEREIGREIYRTRVHPLLAEMGRESVTAMVGWANDRADGHTMIFLAFGGYLLLSMEAYFGGDPIDHGTTAERLAWLIQYGVRGHPSGIVHAPAGRTPQAAPAAADTRTPAASSGPLRSAPVGPVRTARIRRERSDAIANRNRLLDAAREQFFARGFGGATTREIAKAADTTESALYRHFSSKEQLFYAAIGGRLQEIVDAGQMATESELPQMSSDRERLDFLRAQHLHYLTVIEQTAPLLGAALFSERDAGTYLYRSIIAPFLDSMIEATSGALSAWANDGADARTLIFIAVGGYLLISLDAYFRETMLDHEAVADQIAWLLYYGVAGGTATTSGP